MISHLLIALLMAGTRISSADFRPTSQSTTPPMSIIGTWETERCVVQERDGIQTSSRSLFVFLAREWALEFAQYSDAACTMPSLRAFFQGRYRLTGPSSAVSGAHHADFEFSIKRLTLYDDGLLAQANRGACGHRAWTRGREEDVSQTGCLWVVPVSACPQEFDLVKVDDERLFLGERPPAGQNLCREDRRARALRSLPLVRRIQGSPAAGQSSAGTEQPERRPQYQSQPYEEDWRVLQDPAWRTDFWDPVKYIQLNEHGWYLSLGGESRLRYEAVRNAAFGSGPQDRNGYLLQRYLAHADLHGRHVRVFVEIQSGLEAGRTGGPRPTDEDALEFHEAFVEVRAGQSPRSFTVRVGRHEVAFGAGRLISPSEGRNVRRSFDAVRPIMRLGPWTWNALVAKLVAVAPGMFDDGHERGQTFGGFGFIRTRRSRPGEGTSGYYLRFDRRDARFDQGVAREVRQTVGSRTWGRWASVDYNYELVFQWGSFGGAPIRAWAIATDTGYLLPSVRWPSRLSLRTAVTTGDRRREDPALQTFNPLFPGTAYSGRAGLVGPANSIDVTPSVRVAVSRRLSIMLDHAWYRRHSARDGLYGIGVNVIRPGGESGARKVGRQLTVQADFRVDDHFTVAVTSTFFFAGRFLRETPPGSDVTFVAVSPTYRFD